MRHLFEVKWSRSRHRGAKIVRNLAYVYITNDSTVVLQQALENSRYYRESVYDSVTYII